MCLTIATDAVCCAGSTICSLACCCCKSCFGTTFKEQIKLSYITLNVAFMLFTVFCLYFLQELFASYVSFIKCPPASGGDQLCLGISAVYRMSFVLACLYLILLIFMLARGEVAKAANEGLWALKLLFISAFFFGCLFIPNTFFELYVEFAQVISGLYLIFQIVMLIDVFYLWGQSLVRQYDQGQLYGIVLIIIAVILYGGAFTLNIFNFFWFAGCGENVFMNIFTLFIIVAITAVQLLGYNPAGSLICSGSMSLYITYQAFSAQASSPKESCNQLYLNPGVMITEIVFGFLMNIVALLYLTFAIKENSSKNLKLGNGLDLTSGFLESKQEKQQDKINEENKENELNPEQQNNQQQTAEQQLVAAKALVKQDELAPYENNSYIMFHSIMLITVIYMAMMITNWGAPSLQNNTISGFQPNATSYWIKCITSWIAALIYIWTLVAPGLFPDREFN